MASWRFSLKSFSFLVFSLFFSEVTFSANQPQIKRAENTVNVGLVVFPPYTSRDDDNNCVGPHIDALKVLFAKSVLTLNIICAPAARVYRMMSNGEVDLTINVKTTQGLANSADFFPKPFWVLTLALYNYENATEKSISAIRAFDYNGYRDKLQNDGFRFIDVPTAEDAVELFVRRRSQYLISYKTPYDYYLIANDVKFETQVNTRVLQNIPTYIAISRMSAHRLKLLDWLSTIDNEQFESLLEMAEHL